MNFNFADYGISAEEFENAKNFADLMLASGTEVVFDESTMEDTATSIHNLVRLAQERLSKESFRACCAYLRLRLAAECGIEAPADDFLFFGGRCVPAPTIFLPRNTFEELGEKMAQEVVDKMGTEDETSTEGMISVLLECAAMDDLLLAYRTRSLADKLPASGNFTMLPDGSFLSLHYMYGDD